MNSEHEASAQFLRTGLVLSVFAALGSLDGSREEQQLTGLV
jgi:hypothetical protein